MNRSPLVDRFGLRSKVNKKSHVHDTHLGIEPLEERRLLSASDLLVSTFDDTRGSSVLRYDDNTQLPVPGSVATGTGGLAYAQGLAVAPDGSYYVSSLATGQVLHFANSGGLLGVLGAGDANPAPLKAPAALAFGPNGNLYVADWGTSNNSYQGFVYQFNINATGQQYVDSNTLPLGSYFFPGGFTFAADATKDLVVGSLEFQSVMRFPAAGGAPTMLIDPGSGIVPAAMVPVSSDKLLISDIDFGGQPYDHHQIILDNPTTDNSWSQFINLTTPVGTGAAAGHLPQPTAMMVDTDGNLLVGLSPDHNGNGAVEKFDIHTGEPISTLVSGIGTPSGLGLVPKLSVMTVASTDWTNAGSSGLTLTRTSDGMFQVYYTDAPNQVILSQSVYNVGQIQIAGPDNTAGVLTIDFSGGSPIPPGGVTFDSGVNSGSNTIMITGSTDPSATIQTTGNVTFGQGGPTSGTHSNSFTIESGTISSLTAIGGLNKTGSGAVMLSGSNHYQGGTTVVGGTLVVTSSAALPDGTALTVGAGAASIFGSSAVVQAAPVSSNLSAVVAALSAAANVMPTAPDGSPGLAPTAAAFVAVSVPAAAPSKVASDSIWSKYTPTTGSVVLPASQISGGLVWWDFLVASSNSEATTAGDDRQIAALDALLTQYGR